MNWCVTEGYLDRGGVGVLPPVPKDEQRFLIRSEAAKQLWPAWRRRWRWKNGDGVLHTNMHLPMFILVGLYHGAREEAILGLPWQPNTQGGYVNLERSFIDSYPIDPAHHAPIRRRMRWKAGRGCRGWFFGNGESRRPHRGSSAHPSSHLRDVAAARLA